MIFNGVRKLEKPQKLVVDFLNFVEKQTNLLLDHTTLEGLEAWVTTSTGNPKVPTLCLPAEFYRVSLKNYSVRFEIKYCLCECCQKITDIDLIPSNSYYEEDLKNVTNCLETIVPNISTHPFIPNFGYVRFN